MPSARLAERKEPRREKSGSESTANCCMTLSHTCSGPSQTHEPLVPEELCDAAGRYSSLRAP